MAPGAAPPSRGEFFWALAAVRSRTFSGPYVASTLADRLRLAGLVGFLAVGNVLATGPGGIAQTAGAAVAVFVFNILYEVILSQKLKQYAMCPVIDLANHSSAETVRARVGGWGWGEASWQARPQAIMAQRPWAALSHASPPPACHAPPPPPPLVHHPPGRGVVRLLQRRVHSGGRTRLRARKPGARRRKSLPARLRRAWPALRQASAPPWPPPDPSCASPPRTRTHRQTRAPRCLFRTGGSPMTH